jgi:predicted PurR-regulated permease PerM
MRAMERPAISSAGFRTAFVLILEVAVSSLFLAVIWPFFKALLLAALLASRCGPLFSWILRLVRGRRSLAAILTLLILFLLVAGPLSAFVGVVVSQAPPSSARSIIFSARSS